MTILLLETIHPEAHERLAAASNVVLAEDAVAAEFVARRESVQAIMTRGRGQVDASLLELCPELKVVARVGVGLDNIDVDAATNRSVPVINAPGSTTIATAEQALLLIAALLRGLLPIALAVKRGDWSRRSQYRGDDLAGKTLGIIGMGAIGRRVAMLAEAFGMSVVYSNRTRRDVPYPQRSMDELLAEADVVSLHLALTPETRHAIGKEQLSQMKRGAILINTARGAIIDQAALVEALASGHLGGFAADVLEAEPPAADEPLLQFDNVIVTPHVAALTDSTYRRMCLRSVDNVLGILEGRRIPDSDIVNR